MPYVLVLILSLCFSANIYAAPSISGVNGTVSHGSSITISGSGFGTKAQAAPQIWDTVDNQAYTGITDGQTIPVGGSNPWDGNYNNVEKMETTDEQRNSVSNKCYKTAAVGIGIFNDTNITGGSKIYVSWWWKADRDVSINYPLESSKFLRISDSSDPVNKTFSWTEHRAYLYNATGGGYGSQAGALWAEYYDITNSWNFHECWIDMDSMTFDVYTNRQLAKHAVVTGVSTFNVNQVNAIGWDGGGSVVSTPVQWMDDIYVDNTFQRVMLCNGTTYTNSTFCEMQIPSAWSESSITATVNTGSFATSSSAYLYVVDSTGAVSPEFDVTIGDGSDTTAPTISVTQGSSVTVRKTRTTTLTGTCSDAVGVSWAKWRAGAAPDGSNGTACTGSTSWSCDITGLGGGSNDIRVGCGDAAGNVGTATVNVEVTKRTWFH